MNQVLAPVQPDGSSLGVINWFTVMLNIPHEDYYKLQLHIGAYIKDYDSVAFGAQRDPELAEKVLEILLKYLPH